MVLLKDMLGRLEYLFSILLSYSTTFSYTLTWIYASFYNLS